MIADLKPHQQQVLDEYKALREKREAMADFINKPNEAHAKADAYEQYLLDEQLSAMRRYEHVLALRMHHWGIPARP